MSGPPERTVSAPPAGALLRANGFNNCTLWHAGSGMSVNSDFKVSPAAFNLNEDLEPIQPSVRPFALVDDERCVLACSVRFMARSIRPPFFVSSPMHVGAQIHSLRWLTHVGVHTQPGAT